MQSSTSHFHTPLAVAFPRPSRLSDPHNDWSDEALRAILAKPDAELAWNDFTSIFGPYLPAGTYEEGVYFLPLAFEHIAAHDKNALDLVTSLVWFISKHADRLAADGLLLGSRARLVECFQMWTSRFDVVHLDHAACRAKGWRIPYDDDVEHSQVIIEGTCALVDFVRHADLAEQFFRSLADFGSDPMRAAWFLEMSRRMDDAFTRPPDTKTIRRLLADEDLVNSAAAIVQSSLVTVERSPTYWHDTFYAVGVMP